VVQEARVKALRAAAIVAVVSALAVAALPGTASAANECNGVPKCIPIEGPWVAVPTHGEVVFALSCPHGQGIIAGTDADASSLDVRVTFDGILGAPVAFGRTTHSSVLFRGVSARHKEGSFKPAIGCIPSPASVRNTIAAQQTPVGPPLDLRFKTVSLKPGTQTTVTVSCPAGELLVDSWSATAFNSSSPPPPGLASGIRMQSHQVGQKLLFALSASEALPANAHAQVQVGVRCTDPG
jgi:hypothetical protein